MRARIRLHGLVAALILAMITLSAPSFAQTEFIIEYESGSSVTTPRAAAPEEPRSLFAVKHYIELDRPLDFGEHFWDESFAQANNARGFAQIVVDLEAEQLYVYREGIEIARTRITRGWEEYDTPTGIFPILEKDADHYSSTYDNAPMPYNLRLTWKGVAIHGAEVDSVSATHGCIGVPLDFARKLFANVRKGDKVLVTRNWRPEVY
ncbi:L,D-transpeptidase family protein [uncultured Parasphingorhabdus sp.]|uniref:L,D-transpeptidase family protein n=1 Tax=uncultured Parasphingorhabdus sp. TaxID=2709694 RepID=UPI002AA758E7|nr:L,D-transpeptidase family protein [uncultured Parasphingorhabdus sp.]